jgi:beta-glucosidase-like glycosyl hydrolase/CubicO group peptidase (beta-lactamase class C family)
MKIRLAFLFVIAALLPLLASAQWSPDSMLSTMTLREQIGQLLMPPVYSHPGKVNWEEAEDWVRSAGIGGVICMQGGPELQKERIARLQAQAKIPLWTASDAEWGLGMRLDSTRSWPRAMTLGAADDTALTRSIAQEMGRELRSVGIHVNFAPVVDVNSNPANPVIGNRSFGESVERVSLQGVAFAQGLQDVGILATAKHFPGHGDTDADSHLTLPTIAHSRDRLDSVELEPFRALTEAGVGAMMAAHLYIPSLDSTPGQPSTLSPAIVSDLLRGELGFDGIVFTDAMTMKGFEDFSTTETPHVDALLAGNDVLLFPGPPAEVLNEVLGAVEAGQLDSAFIAQKCLRVLQAKSHWSRPLPFNTDPDRAEQLHRRVVALALTVLVNRQRALPIKSDARDIAVVHVQSKGEPDWFSANLGRILGNAYNIEAHEVPATELATTGYEVLSNLEDSPPDWIFLNVRDLNSRASNGWGLSEASIGWMELLAAKFETLNTKVGLIINGSPYLLGPLERLSVLSDALIVAYQDDQRTQEALASAIAGAGPALGKLPVGAGGFEIGAGKPMLGRERLGFSPVRWEGSTRIDSVVQLALDAGAMPGCRVVVAHKGQIIHNENYGTIDGRAPVSSETLYDLASITKVFASTLSLMWLEERGFLHRTDKLADHLPELQGLELGERTFEQILSHTAGLTPWIPFYVEALEAPEVFVDRRDATHNLEVADGLWMADAYRDSIWTRIVAEPLAQPGKERYSDLGYYLMQRVIERLTEQSLDAFVADQFYTPLALKSTTYRPAERFDLSLIAPTENDQVFRRQTIHGHVHDPGAAMLGGVAGHAGLFSDAMDCTRLMQMMINGGIYGRHHVFQAATVKSWTHRVSEREGCRKACGWDKPAEEPSVGSCCDEAGWGSFGHSGFTGTLVWGDPDAELVYVFLSNRVHPDAENWKLVRMNTRTEIQRVIYESLGIRGRFAPSASS